MTNSGDRRQKNLRVIPFDDSAVQIGHNQIAEIDLVARCSEKSGVQTHNVWSRRLQQFQQRSCARSNRLNQRQSMFSHVEEWVAMDNAIRTDTTVWSMFHKQQLTMTVVEKPKQPNCQSSTETIETFMLPLILLK